MKIELIETRDGSSSLFVPELNETYHSTHGAIAESNYVFIEKGLKYCLDKHNHDSINILEVGFGTGLNALLTAIFSQTCSTSINLYTLETFPLNMEIIDSLNYLEQLNDKNSKILFDKIHKTSWEKLVKIRDTFHLQKIESALGEFESDVSFDLVYFDAFAPSKQPEMWTEDIFKHIYKMMNPDASLVTYCAQGQFKRNLKGVGFAVESLPGPPPKKEMVRANKP